ncbi:hypothetical protein MSAN_01252900 [Mycena sanguinolenta]|uniref:Uncharacterized protein n=1 Tax=Mycena sanguinolenta TaxID=230812 RepID=A0A8H6YHK5_9AGAR|nr:hypothetical protein MSAN_01252900 [Mycena sanguinolenta]
MADVLEPIVIPAIKVDKHFTCLGSGLLYEGQERVSAESLRSLLLPLKGRNGISDRDRSKAWWGAQALFYGLKYVKSMTIPEVRAQLEDALRDNKGLRVPQSILDLEYKYNKEFRELNAQVRNKAGMGTKRKREADPPAPPKATSSKSKPAQAELSPDPVPKKKPRVKQAADDVPVAKPRAKQTAKKSMPVARDQQMPAWGMDVAPQPQPVEAPKPRPKQTARKTTGTGTQSSEQQHGAMWWDADVKPQVVEAAKPRTKQTARKTIQPGIQMDVDVKPRTKQTARKTIKAEDFDDFDDPYAIPVGAASSSTMPGPPPRTKQTARRGNSFLGPSSQARSSAPRTDVVSGHWSITCPFIAQEWGSEYMDPEDFHMNIIRRGGTLEAEFELGIISGLLRSDRVEERGPNGAYATVRWAGQENEGPVCTPSASRSGYIKFTGDQLKGKLNDVPACGEGGVEFEGRWEGGASQITATWEDYNEDAYERANRSRWGGGWGGGWS